MSRKPSRSADPRQGRPRALTRVSGDREVSGAGQEARGEESLQSPWVRLRSATRHPFIYRRMVESADEAARPGDIVQVYDRAGRFFGRGLYNPRSQIVVRMLTHEDVPVDDRFWRDRLLQALELRRALRLEEVTDAYRLVHAEGDQLSGLVVERYGDCLVFELFALGMHVRRASLARLLVELLGVPVSLDRPGRPAECWTVVFRADAHVQQLEGLRLERPEICRLPEPQAGPAAGTGAERSSPLPRVVIREHGVRYRVDLTGGQKTGFFCDQRDNRRRFAELCRGARVLDLCCYTGAFGLCARLVGGAQHVTGVDLDEKAIALARQNAHLNQTRLELVHADVFPWLRQRIDQAGQYDAVVLDPPRLALSRAQYPEALRKYGDLNALALRVVRPGGFLLTCSCSGLVSRAAFAETVFAAARRAGRHVQVLDVTGAAPDHPLMPDCPESAYLKCLWLRVL